MNNAKVIPIVKKLAAGTKIGAITPDNLDPLLEVLAIIDPGWSTDTVVGATPVTYVSGELDLPIDKAKIQSAAGNPPKFSMSVYHHAIVIFWDREVTVDEGAIAKEIQRQLQGVIEVSKKSTNAKLGMFYVASKPEPSFDPGRCLVDFDKLKRGVELVQLTAPSGVETVLTTPASIWKALKVAGVPDKAKAWLEGAGSRSVTEDTARRALGVGTNNKVGACPVCTSTYKLNRRERIVLHGYTRPGWGFIQGSCFGVNYEPWERSPKGAEDWLNHLVTKTLVGFNKGLADEKATRSYVITVANPQQRQTQSVNLSSDGTLVVLDDGDKERSTSDLRKHPSIDRVRVNPKNFFDSYKEERIRVIEHRIKEVKAAIADTKTRLSSWKPAKLPHERLGLTAAATAATLHAVADRLSR